MGLDIYAGTLTRYYSHNWKTVVQQWAEENGYSFNRITPDGEPADNEEEMSPAEVQAAVENWRDQILSAISQPGQPPYAPWLEDNEKPYYTDKPDWDAFGAMLLVAACRTYEEPVPSTVEKDWIFGEHAPAHRVHIDLVAAPHTDRPDLVFLDQQVGDLPPHPQHFLKMLHRHHIRVILEHHHVPLRLAVGLFLNQSAGCDLAHSCPPLSSSICQLFERKYYM